MGTRFCSTLFPGFKLVAGEHQVVVVELLRKAYPVALLFVLQIKAKNIVVERLACGQIAELITRRYLQQGNILFLKNKVVRNRDLPRRIVYPLALEKPEQVKVKVIIAANAFGIIVQRKFPGQRTISSVGFFLSI